MEPIRERIYESLDYETGPKKITYIFMLQMNIVSIGKPLRGSKASNSEADILGIKILNLHYSGELKYQRFWQTKSTQCTNYDRYTE